MAIKTDTRGARCMGEGGSFKTVDMLLVMADGCAVADVVCAAGDGSGGNGM